MALLVHVMILAVTSIGGVMRTSRCAIACLGVEAGRAGRTVGPRPAGSNRRTRDVP